MKKIVMAFILAILIPTNVKAYFCDFSEINRLKKISSNINTSIDYEHLNDEYIFSITFNNLDKELYILDTITNKKYEYTGKELIISGYNDGEKLLYEIYTSSDCYSKPLRTIRINLPKANEFYGNDLCKGIENYSLCKKWSNHNLSFDKWKNKIINYKTKISEDTNNNQGIIYKEYPILNFIGKYYYIFLVTIIITCGIGIYYLNKKSSIYS